MLKIYSSIDRMTSVYNSLNRVPDVNIIPRVLERQLEQYNKLNEIIPTINLFKSTPVFNEHLLTMSNTLESLMPTLQYYKDMEPTRSMIESLSLIPTIAQISKQDDIIRVWNSALSVLTDYINDNDINLSGYDKTQAKIEDDYIIYKEESVSADSIQESMVAIVNNINNDIAELPESVIEKIRRNWWVIVEYIKIVMACLIIAVNAKELAEESKKRLFKIKSKKNGWDKMYRVFNENGARVYAEAKTSSAVVGVIEYSKLITITDSIPGWVKGKFGSSLNEIEGWIAKRNLFSYEKEQMGIEMEEISDQ